MQARMTREFGAVEEIGNKILKANGSNEFIQRALARQFDELGQSHKALVHWQALRDGNPRDFEASCHLARAYAREGQAIDKAVAQAAPDASETFHGHLLAVLENDAEAIPYEGDLKNVVICGVSYCGSTMFDRLLGSLPGTASVGESHWLVKGKSPKGGYDLLDFDRDFVADMVKCTVCGTHCSVLSAEFRRSLAADRTNWYFRIAEKLGTRTLIACDKNPPKIVDNDPLLRLDALVLFKSLPQAWWSELQKRKTGQGDAYYLSECERYVGTWSRSYAMFLESFVPAGKVVFLSFEAFAQEPTRVLKAGCQALSLPFDETVLQHARRGHAIGGNDATMRRLKTSDYTPNIAPLEPAPLPESHLEIINESLEAKRVFELMERAHEATMSAAT
jgi:hypothetical protein